MTLANANYILPYQPFPSEKMRFIREGLRRCNFDDALLREGHIFTATGQGLRVHQSAFTDSERQDVITSGVNFYYNFAGMDDGTVLDRLAFSGAPFNLIGNDTLASLYMTNIVSDKVQTQSIGIPTPYQNIPELLTNYNVDIAPQRIYRAKQGLESFVAFPNWNPLQLRLFAIEATRGVLVKQFSAALNAMRQAPIQTLTDEEITEVVVQLLAAVILAHKGKFGDRYIDTDISLGELIETANRQFNRYFKPALIRKSGAPAQDAYAILQQVRFSSFVIDYLEELYIEAYPLKQARSREGRYNTPLFLTQRILANMPIETIRPADRVVVDMTCGVGNFLQAAYGRLAQMTDMQPYTGQLREHIFGNDHDELTAQLASLSLLLTSFTDHWEVDAADALQWTSPKRPTVIVGNPPFGGNRKLGRAATTLDTDTGDRRRLEKANAFLERAIQQLAPGGYLAMVMPQSFVASEAGQDTRKMLLEECDVLEIWELPGDIFIDASLQPMVIFAQRKDEEESGKISTYPVRVRTAQRKAARLYQDAGIFTASSLQNSQSRWGQESKRRQITYIMNYQFTLPPSLWEKIHQQTHRLDDIVDMTRGASIGSRSRWRWTDYKLGKRVRWLSSAKQSLQRQFFITYGDETVFYPNELEEPRKNRRNPQFDKEYLLANDKVLLAAIVNPSWGQRAIVAIERKGYYPSQGFWVLAPNQQHNYISLEALAAIVSWYVSNGWIVEHLQAPFVPSSIIQSIPFPKELDASACDRLTWAVRHLEAAAQRGEVDLEAQQTIDRILKAAYNLDDYTFERLRMIPQWDDLDDEQLHEQLRSPLPNPAKLLDVTGGVEEVNTQEDSLTLWLNGFPRLQTVPIVDVMPGWMLRPGAAFKAQIPQEHFQQQSLENVTWFNIVPQEYTYLSEDELIDELDRSFANIALR